MLNKKEPVRTQVNIYLNDEGKKSSMFEKRIINLILEIFFFLFVFHILGLTQRMKLARVRTHEAKYKK